MNQNKTQTSVNEKLIQITVPPKKAKERIDAFLARELPQISRSQVQKMIKDGFVTVNGKAIKAKHIVNPGEQIQVVQQKPEPSDILAEDIPLNIVFEDEYLMVINKPAGMVVHPAYGHSTGTLVNALLSHCNDLSDLNDMTRPGIVHRIDKDTSGLLVIAKSNHVHHLLANQFAEKSVDRIYHAFAWGKFKLGTGTVHTNIARSFRDRKKMAVTKMGKHAVTHYRILKNFPLISLVELKLETGRTHQIRVHLSHIGHPVFGDQTYGGVGKNLGGLSQRDTALAVEWLNIMPRQALHAKTLGFIHPITEKKLHFNSELPEDMAELLIQLENTNKMNKESS